MRIVNDNKVASELDMLASLDREGLAKRWTESFDCPAPRGIHAMFLLRALAWHCQMTVYGMTGAKNGGSMLKKLKRSTSTVSNDSLAPGTRLLREWQGKTYHVTVLNSGFEYEGKTYKSLTAITRHITGTPWSGPQFFGLRS